MKQSRSESMHNMGFGSVPPIRSPLSDRNPSTNPALISAETPQFFHANEVQSTKASRPNSMSSAPKAWVGGNSSSKVENVPSGRSYAMSNPSSTPEEQRPKFFYAKDELEVKSPPLKSGYVPTPNRPILQTIYSEQCPSLTSPLRPSSPLKDEVTPPKASLTQTSPRQHKRLTSGGPADLKAIGLPSYDDSRHSRRSSVSSQTNFQNMSRARSSSPRGNIPASPRQIGIVVDTSQVEHVRAFPPEAQLVSSPEPSTSPITSTNGITYPLRSQPQSPTKGQSRLDQMNKLAANARRERKVLDLEISNSSLMAINQTLEREIRKMKVELRHYRRLSRSGRLSVPPSRSVSGKMTSYSDGDDVMDSEDDLSSNSEFESDLDDEDDLSNLSTSPSSRPSSRTNRSVNSKFKDIKIVPLDFSAQRSLLLSGQKLNQSIKQCLAYSESLLTSTKQALDQRVNATDMEHVGPKVLTSDEDEDSVIDRRQGLLSPVVLDNDGSSSNPWEVSFGRIGSLNTGLGKADTLNTSATVEEDRDQQPLDTYLETNKYNHQGERHNSEDQISGIETRQLVESYARVNVYKEQPVEPTAEDTMDGAGRTGSFPTLHTDMINEASSLPELRPPPSPLDGRKPKFPQQDSRDDLNRETQDLLVGKLGGAETELGNRSSDADSIRKKEPIEVIDTPENSNPIGNHGNTPGNRSSLKALGNYLQSFSIFANGGLRPP